MAGPTRRTVAVGIALAAGWGGAARVHAADKVFRIAYQKGAVNLVLLKERGTIEVPACVSAIGTPAVSVLGGRRRGSARGRQCCCGRS